MNANAIQFNQQRAFEIAKSAAPFVVAIAIMMPLMSMAGTDTTFDNIVTMLTGWLTGSLGKVLALAGLAIALGAGLVKGSAMGVIFGITVALVAVYGPDIMTTMFSATF